MTLSVLLLSVAAIFYLGAVCFHALSFWDLYERGHTKAVWFLRIGFAAATIYFISEAIQHQVFLPVISHDQVLAFLAWSLAFVYLILLVRVQSDSFGLVMTPVLFALTALAVPTRIFCKDLHWTINPKLRDVYFAAHVSGAFWAYAAFGIAFAAGVLLLLQHHQLKSKQPGALYRKLPSLEELDRMIRHALIWGCSLLAVATIIGLIWSKKAFGEVWMHDPKTMATLLLILAYALVLLGRISGKMSARRTAGWTVAIFFGVMMSFVGLRFVPGSHDYFKKDARTLSPADIDAAEPSSGVV